MRRIPCTKRAKIYMISVTQTLGQLGPYLEQLLAAPPDERSQILATFGQENPALKDTLSTLLNAFLAHGDKVDALFTHVEDLKSEGKTTTLGGSLTRGSIVEKYEIISFLGAGGMGEVYKAQRRGHIEQVVALKVFRQQFASINLAKHFEQEQQFLARLNHPHIAHFIDAGQTPLGHPYLAMELVEGIPITEYCDEKKLDISQRLVLFLQICEALQYAHQQQIVHRDIKPANILVTEGGQVKILDFGIARSLGEESPSQTLQWLFTPDFASPEQFKQEPLTPASDVYSLGILLFVLLVGQRPYRLEQAAPFVLWQTFQQTPFPKLHQAVWQAFGTTSHDPFKVAAHRHTTPRQLTKEVKGDLARIVDKATSRDINNRYTSVQALADDISRFIAQKPIQARPPGVGYRIHRFANRHFVPIAAVLAVILLTSLGSAYLIYREAQKTEAKFTENQVIQQFITSFLFDNQLGINSGLQLDSLQTQKFLNLAMFRIEKDLQEIPRARFSVWRSLIDFALQRRLFREAESMMTRIEPQMVNYPDLMAGLLGQKTVLSLYKGHPPQKSLEYVAQAKYLLTKYPNPEVETEVMIAEGVLQGERGEWQSAQRLLERALQNRREGCINEPCVGMFNVLQHLGDLWSHQKQYDKALPYYREVLQSLKNRLGENHVLLVVPNANMGSLLAQLRHYERAMVHYKEALRINDLYFQSTHDDRQMILLGMASVESKQGYKERALMHFQQILAIQQQTTGERSFPVGLTNRKLAQTYLDLNLQHEALEPAIKSLRIFEENFGPLHPETIAVKLLTAETYLYNNQPKLSEKIIREILGSEKKWMQQDPLASAKAMLLLGWVMVATRQDLEAKQVLEALRPFFERKMAFPPELEGDWECFQGILLRNEDPIVGESLLAKGKQKWVLTRWKNHAFGSFLDRI